MMPIDVHATDSAIEPVPEFFQAKGEAAARSQVEWLEVKVGMDDDFFARLLHLDRKAFRAWKHGKGNLAPEKQALLGDFWRCFLNLLSFQNSDVARVRAMLEHEFKLESPTTDDRSVPPWAGLSMRDYLQRGGVEAIDSVNRWTTSFRFADTYAQLGKG
jgi:hypothetical protein